MVVEPVEDVAVPCHVNENWFFVSVRYELRVEANTLVTSMVFK